MNVSRGARSGQVPKQLWLWIVLAVLVVGVGVVIYGRVVHQWGVTKVVDLGPEPNAQCPLKDCEHRFYLDPKIANEPRRKTFKCPHCGIESPVNLFQLKKDK